MTHEELIDDTCKKFSAIESKIDGAICFVFPENEYRGWFIFKTFSEVVAFEEGFSEGAGSYGAGDFFVATDVGTIVEHFEGGCSAVLLKSLNDAVTVQAVNYGIK